MSPETGGLKGNRGRDFFEENKGGDGGKSNVFLCIVCFDKGHANHPPPLSRPRWLTFTWLGC